MRFLLDVNVLVALAFPEHPSYRAANAWFHSEPNRLWATCPLTQAGFVRVASHDLHSRDGVHIALAALEQNCLSPQHEFWAAEVDLRQLSNSIRARLTGRNQIADLQLLMIAHKHRGKLATFDTGLKELASNTSYADTLIVL